MFLKRLIDLFGSLFGIIISSPLLIIIAFAIKFSSKGPVFFKQTRLTKNGKEFKMLKFRSMYTDIPEGKPHWTEENDSRITPVGKLIRHASLDELPQLFNVLIGDMSLVGPRPERPELVVKFKQTVPHYSDRLRVKAGMTGWAQVNGFRGNTSLEKRVELDNYYIDNMNVFFDIKILFLTVFKGFVNSNAY